MLNEMQIQQLEALFSSQTTGVLATEMNHRPYANLVAFSYSNDFKKIYFVTQKNTKKYDNLCRNPNISMIIDNRQNDPFDFNNATAVTVIGQAAELTDESRIEYIERHRKRLPGLEKFTRLASVALFEIEIQVYIVANGLTNISTFYL
jgi:nitroimidazol reductase NimA-like FMN-containing flavoprotein (pyridoxamine 5'-phosphate oxidase superfamily)